MIKAYFQMKFDPDEERSLDLDAEMLSIKHIGEDLQKADADLFQTKWFDYRRMTPLQATLKYITHYGEAYRATYRREIDRNGAEHVRVIGATEMVAGLMRCDTKLKRRMSSYWRGRQVADAIGMPYDLYIRWAFEFRMRRWQRAYLPQPQHLYHEYDVEKIVDRWEEHQASIFVRPQDSAFMVENYQGIPYQDDFHEWLFKIAYMRANPEHSIAAFIEEHLLPIDKAAARLGEDFARVEPYL